MFSVFFIELISKNLKDIYKLLLFRNYDEARKAYLNALKHDPKNQNVLRDLGQLQI